MTIKANNPKLKSWVEVPAGSEGIFHSFLKSLGKNIG
jgi:hypothetical protein